MAAGRVLNDSHISGRIVLLDGSTGVDDGQWVDMDRWRAISLYLNSSGGAAFTVQLRGSSAEIKPANNTQGVQLGADIVVAANGEQFFSVAGFTYLENPPWYVKARVSAFTTGVATAILVVRGW